MFVSKKKFQELEDRVASHERDFLEFTQNLNSNGVATAINRLTKEVFGTVKKESTATERVMAAHWRLMDEMYEGVTIGLKDKIDAITDHLKVNLSVQKASTKVKVTPIKKKAGK